MFPANRSVAAAIPVARPSRIFISGTDAPYPGGATLPFCLRNYAEIGPKGTLQDYHTSGLPAKGTRLAQPTALPALYDLFCNWLPGEYLYRVSHDELGVYEETVLLDFDEIGRFRLRSRRHAAQLSAFLSENVFYATDYEGPGASVLALISAGLARVPCMADPGLVWQDLVSPAPFYSRILGKLHDVIDPFLRAGLLDYRYSMQVGELGFEITCRRHNQDETWRSPFATAPRQIVTTLASRFGVQRIDARFGNDVRMTAELIDPIIPREEIAILPESRTRSGSHGVFSRE